MPIRTAAAVAIVLTFCMAITSSRAAEPPASEPPPGEQRGEFPTSFSERSPLSSPKELGRRLASRQVIADYDLAPEKFFVYVPKTYDPAAPAGLIVYHCYKAAPSTPPTWAEMLDKRNLIFVVANNLPEAIPTRIGLGLDAVHNLQKQYKIDPTRVWALGEDAAALSAFAYPDVFTAGVFRQASYFRPIRSKTGGSFTPKFAPPAGDYVTKAKRHPMALLNWPKMENDPTISMASTMQQDGFKLVMSVPVDTEPYHYPNFTTEWFEPIIEFIEKNPPPKANVASAAGSPSTQPDEPAAAAVPATSPAPAAPAATTNEPQKLLNLAKNYINARSFGPARKRLETIIEKFPDDPAAAEAKKLLKTLP